MKIAHGPFKPILTLLKRTQTFLRPSFGFDGQLLRRYICRGSSYLCLEKYSLAYEDYSLAARLTTDEKLRVSFFFFFFFFWRIPTLECRPDLAQANIIAAQKKIYEYMRSTDSKKYVSRVALLFLFRRVGSASLADHNGSGGRRFPEGEYDALMRDFMNGIEEVVRHHLRHLQCHLYLCLFFNVRCHRMTAGADERGAVAV